MWERLVPNIAINIHAKDDQGNTMMHKAAENGSIELLTWLICKGARGMCTIRKEKRLSSKR
jgi:ankyrin repeat protein